MRNRRFRRPHNLTFVFFLLVFHRTLMSSFHPAQEISARFTRGEIHAQSATGE
jgi:hypothetical protein